MSKRKRDSLTGGTGDVKPQILTLASQLPAALNDYTVNQHLLPIPRFSGEPKNTATVFEILAVDWYIGEEDAQFGIFNANNWAFLGTLALRIKQTKKSLIGRF